jgi:sec-independent protein translocase protein TatC
MSDLRDNNPASGVPDGAPEEQPLADSAATTEATSPSGSASSSELTPVSDLAPAQEDAQPVTFSRSTAAWRPKDEDAEVVGSEDGPIVATPSAIDWEHIPELAPLADSPPPLLLDSSSAQWKEAAESAALAPEEEVETTLAPEMGASDFDAAERDEAESLDRELDLLDHLGELRQRILRSVAAVGIMMVATWAYRDALLEFFSRPIVAEIRRKGGELITLNPAEGFTLYVQITFAAAVILAIPVVIYQLWAFIEPALTKKERRYGIILVPFSVTLFFVGAGFGFYLTPLFFRFFLEYQPPGTMANWSYAAAASLLAKMLLVFGICFQVPVITVFVNKIGLVSRNWMIDYWRHVVIVMFTIVAIITPTWDPVTLFAAALPPCILYAFSIWLVKWL